MKARRSSAFVAVVVAMVSLVSVGAAFAGNGNSANAKACQKGGWESLYRSDGSSFSSQDACVSYAAKGGTLSTTPPGPLCLSGASANDATWNRVVDDEFNLSILSSTNGTCGGVVRRTGTLVVAPDAAAAATKCSLYGSGVLLGSLNLHYGTQVPEGSWFCV